jgi:hypothetical protein
MRTRRRQVLAVIAVIEVISAVFAWRDMRQRPDDSIRGTKRFWHVVVLMNPGNSLLYWIFGRRSPHPRPNSGSIAVP